MNEVKYLGIILDKNLTFDSQVKNICKKVNMHLNCFCINRRDLSCQTAKIHAYNYIFTFIILHYIMVTNFSNYIEAYCFNIQT